MILLLLTGPDPLAAVIAAVKSAATKATSCSTVRQALTCPIRARSLSCRMWSSHSTCSTRSVFSHDTLHSLPSCHAHPQRQSSPLTVIARSVIARRNFTGHV